MHEAALKERLNTEMSHLATIHVAIAIWYDTISKACGLVLEHILVRFLENIICEKMPKFHTCFKDLVARLLVFLSYSLAIGRHQICALDDVLQTDVSVLLEELNVLIFLHCIACLLD